MTLLLFLTTVQGVDVALDCSRKVRARSSGCRSVSAPGTSGKSRFSQALRLRVCCDWDA